MKANNVACKTGRLKRPRKRKRLAKRRFAQANEVRQRVAQLGTCSFGRRGIAHRNQGLLPDSSGGAVVLSPPILKLAGIHTGSIYHLEEDLPDQQQLHDQARMTLPAIPVMELEEWTAEHSASGQKAAAGKQKKVEAASMSSNLEQQILHCIKNIEHKRAMGTIVPSHTLHWLYRNVVDSILLRTAFGQMPNVQLSTPSAP
ncbi:hypothetical protein VOLCADRAFT_88958 [Volvox carteri f. nagariensis]|uniref:Uncharacterized protein n=1 Tax=Volvox carteri f. nagariensis TaxID=3068 RepID=D8TQF0_VOLCA|nr:uncharacterized protein VOLCADRAFT_88958 [Volvox carteri f. nagariensis]EFJ50394.1 hypothetical protein VOLCADRAFT_88958 [Volvox carteri f. nagariensis]|eukprot:XP_002948519.1 hypothetical protein VOLCADRAFT_88958 [Volvox carteri f. nagariensis]